MLSFFTKKKHNPETVPEKVIQGPAEENGGISCTESDDFFMVEGNNEMMVGESGSSIFPSLPYTVLPIACAQRSGKGTTSSSDTTVPVSYLQDVPFNLAKWLVVQKEAELTQIQVDEILSLFTRQMALYDQENSYTFQLERTITEK